jgi:hypothetical protein
MFAGTIVVKNVRLFATRTEFGSSVDTVGFVHAALQCLRTETDLTKHRSYDFRVDGFAVVRCACERDFAIVKAKSIGGAGKQ